jgi:hypothetical protein
MSVPFSHIFPGLLPHTRRRMKSPSEIRASWLEQLYSTAPAERARAEAGLRRLYAAAGFPEPRHFVWYDSPRQAGWSITLLVSEGDRTMTPLLAPSALTPDEKRHMDAARGELSARLGTSDWKTTLAAVGALRLATMAAMADPSRLFGMAFLNARFELDDDVAAMFTVHDDDLARAESAFIGGNAGVLQSATESAATRSVIGHPFYNEVAFSTMADDEKLVGNRKPPAILEASWEIARSAGLWWPFEHAVFLTDRPSEIHVNERKVPHREDGPAIVYRDGWSVYAWNGKRVPKKWIMETETVPPRDYKGFDPTFVNWAKSKGHPADKPKKRSKPGDLLKAPLSTDPALRLQELRHYAGGQLPLYDRYMAGEHRQVWKELVALGPAVREDSHAADALAVAYETMQRVDTNVRTLVQRLVAMNYVFAPDGPPSSGSMTVQMGGSTMSLDDLMRDAGQAGGAFSGLSKLAGLFGGIMKARDSMAEQQPAPKAKSGSAASRAHVPPGPNARKDIANFEKEYGTLPLSLRVFYEVVGEVNLNGTHPALDPEGNSVAPDPLLVYGLDDGIVEFDEDDEEGETASAVTIAPDDLHKANTSGGDAYAMAIPDPRADGELLNERHDLFFLDYLRLCFEYGGFPGYEGRSTAPAELQTLRAGLIEF